MLRFALAFSLILTLSCSIALAQKAEKKEGKPRPTAEERLAKKDANGDGKLSLEEFLAGTKEENKDKLTAAFNKLDSDKDGSVTKEEMKKAQEGRAKGNKGKGKGK